MKSLIKNKKADMEIAIVLFVLCTLLLVIVAIVSFNLKEKDSKEEIVLGSSLDELYARAEILNFYIRDIASKISLTGNVQENFKLELAKLKNKQGFILPDLGQIETQLSQGQHVAIDGGVLRMDFDIVLVSLDGKSSYNYKLSQNRVLSNI